MKNIAPININETNNKYVAHYILNGDGPLLEQLALQQTYIISPHASKDDIIVKVNNPLTKLSKLYG